MSKSTKIAKSKSGRKPKRSTSLPAVSRGSYGEIDFRQIFQYRYKNQLSLDKISDLTGVPKSTLHSWFKPIDEIIKAPELLELYANNKAPILNAIEYKILEQMLNAAKLKKASINNLAFAFDKLFMSGRLERGLSTGNLAINVEKKLTEAHEKAQIMRDKLSKSAGGGFNGIDAVESPANTGS